MLVKTKRFLRSFTPYQIGYLTVVLLIDRKSTRLNSSHMA